MQSTFDVRIHVSQFPDQVQLSLSESLRSGRVNPKFHYESRGQARMWLALHEAYSPARLETGVRHVYSQSFDAVSHQVKGRPVHVIGLGSGGGQKEAELIHRLKTDGTSISFTAIDVSPSLVIASLHQVQSVMECGSDSSSDHNPRGMVCDFGHDMDPFPAIEKLVAGNAVRVFTLFGMLPNFEPDTVLKRLGQLLRPEDVLLVSANLAPGQDYASGVRKVLPQYDNSLTRDWLMTLLLDLGLKREDGQMEWPVEECPQGSGLLRIAAYFRFTRPCTLQSGAEDFPFKAGDWIRLFFSYRYTPGKVKEVLAGYGLKVDEEWVSSSGEEGVFQGRRL